MSIPHYRRPSKRVIIANCIVAAAIEWARLYYHWQRRGQEAGYEPYLLIRPSRLRPRWLPHMLVGVGTDTGQVRVRSFVPLDEAPLRWWQVWRALAFRGRWIDGDLYGHASQFASSGGAWYTSSIR